MRHFTKLSCGLARMLSLGLLASLASLALPSCGSPEEPFRFTGHGEVVTPIEMVSDVPLVEITVEDGPPRPFLLDTGSPATLISPGAFGLSEGIHRPEDVTFLGVTVLEPTLGVLELFGGELTLGGILGGDLLRHFALTLDYREARAVLWVALGGERPSWGTDLGEGAQVPFALRGGGLIALPSGESLRVPATRVMLSLWVEDEEITAVLDTGASTLVLDETLFETLLVTRPDRPRLLGLEVITVGGITEAELSRAARLALSDAPAETESTSVSLMVLRSSPVFQSLSEEVGRPVQALLGGSYLREFQVTLDYPARRLTLRRFPSHPHLDPREWVSVGFTWSQHGPSRVLVDSLFEGRDAQSQGLRPGDRILLAAGRDVSYLGATAVMAAVDASELGDRVPFTLERDGAPYEADVLIEDLLPEYL